MAGDLLEFLRVAAITVGLAVVIWFGLFFAMEGAVNAFKGLLGMIKRDENKIERRTFPAIAWGLTALVVAMFLVLVIAKCTTG